MKRQNSFKRRSELDTGTHWTLCVLIIGLLSLLPVLAEVLERSYADVEAGSSWVRQHLLLRPIDLATHGAVWQFFTYPYLHVTFPGGDVALGTGGMLDLPLWIGAYFTLWFFSRDLERRWGPARFLAYYAFGGVCAGVTACILGPTATVGGSAGAVLAVVTAAALELGDYPVGGAFRLRYVALTWMLVYAACCLTRDADRVTYFAQYGGAVGGLVLLKTYPAVRKWRLAWVRYRSDMRVAEMLRVRNRVDEILDRITQVGVSGLTGEERSFLRRASRLYRNESAERACGRDGRSPPG